MTDRQESANERNGSYSVADMLYLMARLRDPETGCPWDIKQNFETIVPFTLEEVYEVIDTIERGDYPHLKEELGDLLFQVVFYSQLGQEQGYFNFDEVVDTLVSKLVSRHPHVFPEGTLQSTRDSNAEPQEAGIKKTWEALKKAERGAKGKTSLLADIPNSLPALVRAQKIQKRAANVGFDWPDTDGVLDKIVEEAAELKAAVAQRQQAEIEEEMGDLLFSCINLARHLGVDGEGALRRTIGKFEQRFGQIEQAAEASGRQLEELSLDEMDRLWQLAKK